MTTKTVEINITGIVQGVGFRPFLFNTAKKFMLKGYLLNRGNAGVRLRLQGESKNIENFIIDIQKNKPEISYIENLEIKELSYDGSYENLEIKKSEEGRGISLTLPPDIAICDKCRLHQYLRLRRCSLQNLLVGKLRMKHSSRSNSADVTHKKTIF